MRTKNIKIQQDSHPRRGREVLQGNTPTKSHVIPEFLSPHHFFNSSHRPSTPKLPLLLCPHILNKRRMYNDILTSNSSPILLSPQVLLFAVVFIKTHSAAVRTPQGDYALISRAVISGRSGLDGARPGSL